MSHDRLAEAKETVADATQTRFYGGGISNEDALDLVAQLRWAADEVERLRGLLARLEWAGSVSGPATGQARCPACKGLRLASGQGAHEPGCWLAAELRR